MKITSVIIDDETLNISFLSRLVKDYCRDIEVVATASNAKDGITIINHHKPNLVFLDVELHNKSGFDILENIDTTNLYVIMVTAHEKYVLQAIKYAAANYILKPIDIDDLVAATDIVRKQLEQKYKSKS